MNLVVIAGVRSMCRNVVTRISTLPLVAVLELTRVRACKGELYHVQKMSCVITVVVGGEAARGHEREALDGAP